jgi:RND family efflux transporter MFP subunit
VTGGSPPEGKTVKNRILPLTVVAGLGLLGATVLQARMAGRTGEPAPAAPVPAPAVARGVAAEGRVVTYPGAEVKVAAERPGRLVAVLVEEGQAVRKGDLLAEIESEELRAALAEAHARVDEAAAEVRLAEVNLERRRRLVAEQIAAAHDLDQATRDLETSRARQSTAEATAARYEAQLRKSRIVAPLSGTVTAREVDAGETVEPGDVVVSLADLRRLRVDAEADEADASALALGAPVVITADGFPGRTWPGRVEEIAHSVTLRKLKPQDPARPTDTRILAVKVAFGEPAPLRLGTTVEVRIEPRLP